MNDDTLIRARGRDDGTGAARMTRRVTTKIEEQRFFTYHASVGGSRLVRLLDSLGDGEDAARGCVRKNAHSTLDGAATVAAAMTRREGEAFHAYKCRFCDGYHVAHGTGVAGGIAQSDPDGGVHHLRNMSDIARDAGETP